LGLEQAGHTVEEVRLDQILALRHPRVDSHTLLAVPYMTSNKGMLRLP
jgi:hypothetical protein